MLVHAVQIRIGDAALVERAYPHVRALAQLVHVAEEDGLCGAGFGAGRGEAILLPVVAERALPRAPIRLVQVDQAEWASGHAVGAAIADVRLYVDVAEFVPDDGAGWAGVEAAGMRTVLAHITHHEPAVLAEEAHSLPRRGAVALQDRLRNGARAGLMSSPARAEIGRASCRERV